MIPTPFGRTLSPEERKSLIRLRIHEAIIRAAQAELAEEEKRKNVD
jgi:hypothetical protein